ncbi:hypothetical protein DFP72DRAFT_1054630 [Ephemerocybe angulata]|uniref:Uncharacterized protein n=1 Tax=Ephemerocybe angulata TaxID=980116 RepID=A0A8H6H8E8_9AGAR|nr:hypothetical protein DFP72DRAFT_1054630 [Tulosesus angulatus]
MLNRKSTLYRDGRTDYGTRERGQEHQTGRKEGRQQWNWSGLSRPGPLTPNGTRSTRIRTSHPASHPPTASHRDPSSISRDIIHLPPNNPPRSDLQHALAEITPVDDSDDGALPAPLEGHQRKVLRCGGGDYAGDARVAGVEYVWAPV